MRSVVVEAEGVDASADWVGTAIPADYLTRASVSVDVSGASALDGVVALYGSNEKPPSYIRQTQFTPTEGFLIPGASVQVTANGTYSFAVDIAYRYVQARFNSTAGSATLAVRVSLKGWP